MSKSGCEAIPIDSPSSIQSDSPSDLVRSQSETASSTARTPAASSTPVGSGPTLGWARAREATLATGRS
jgi:hypothetical protein